MSSPSTRAGCASSTPAPDAGATRSGSGAEPWTQPPPSGPASGPGRARPAAASPTTSAGDPSFQWAGLSTFERALDDPVFWRSLSNTFIFTVVSMALIVVLGKVLANILVADFRGKWLVRFLVLLPWTTPVALSSISWLWLLDSIFSPIDWVFRQLGLLGGAGALIKPDTNMYWLGEPGLAMASVIAVHVWRLTPLAAVIMVAGLVAIPRDMEEAARVDGAGYWRRMFGGTIPPLPPGAAVAPPFGAGFPVPRLRGLHVHRHGRRRRAHQRRAEQRHPGADELGVLPRHRRRRRRPGRGDRAVPVPAAARR